MTRRLMGVWKDRHGTFYVRQKVPKALEFAVAQVLRESGRRSWLKRSLRTKDPRAANTAARPIQIEFDRVLSEARALATPAPMRSSLSDAEVRMLCDYFYSRALAEDDRLRLAGHGARDHDAPGGLSGMSSLDIGVFAVEDDVAEALAEGNWEYARSQVDAALNAFNIRLVPNGEAYRRVALEMLRTLSRAVDAIRQRNRGEAIGTPRLPSPKSVSTDAGGSTLQDAFEGWQKAQRPAPSTIAEYARALRLFAELHGHLTIANIDQGHAREFREALQDVPRSRTGKLSDAPLPELSSWGKAHPTAPKISAGTVNKIIGGVQAVATWAFSNGYVPKEVRWSDPFAKMRLDEDDALEREAFTVPQLQTFFSDPIFVSGARPVAGRGETAFWLPLLALFTGARQGELAALTAASITVDEDTSRPLLSIENERERGRRTKTASGVRTLPVHSQLLQFGFVKFVERVRTTRGANGWLFPAVSPEASSGQAAWSKWFNRRLRRDHAFPKDIVFHSFRGTFIDALRAHGTPEDLQQALVGQSGGNVTRKNYGAKKNQNIRRYGVPTLISTVDGVEYRGLDLSRVRAKAK